MYMLVHVLKTLYPLTEKRSTRGFVVLRVVVFDVPVLAELSVVVFVFAESVVWLSVLLFVLSVTFAPPPKPVVV